MQRFCHRIVIAALAAVIFIPPGVQAQEQNKDQDQTSQPQSGSQTDGSQRRGRRVAAQRQRQHMDMLAEKLNLTDAQKAQFQQISKDMRKTGMAIRQDNALTAGEKKEKFQDLRKQSHKQMFGILTPEQKEKLKQMREQHKKEEGKEKSSGDQASAKTKAGTGSDDDDPFAGMTGDDDGPGNGGNVQ
jgi:Spy/CpxP family protein refolding chaperone